MTTPKLFVYTLALACALALTAECSAQPSGALGTWSHHFDDRDRTVYLVISAEKLDVWAVHSRTECMRAPRRIEWNGATIVRPARANWHLTKVDGGMDVEMPDTTVTYQRTRDEPRQLCTDGHGT